ncbi:MAG TPA: hypothetical protein VLS93_05725, partial [Anaeromyxobacteraceae bacterium]|nr:hypothetical protein [Anaeromyxobacteraceae bacterium]
MPPVLPQDVFEAVHRAVQARWLDLPMAVLGALVDLWVLVLVALAFHAWMERDVPSALRAFLPVAVVLAGEALALTLLRGAWSAPRVAGEAAASSGALAPVLRHGFPAGTVLFAATFAGHALGRYRWGGLIALPLALAAVATRIYAGPGWAPEVLIGLPAGAVLGVAVHAGVARLGPLRL